MKFLFFAAAFIAPAVAQAKNWEKPSDMFEWPTPSLNPVKKYHRVSELPSEIQKSLIGIRGGASRTPDETSSFSTDLNGDNIPEWFLDLGDGGSGGPIYNIYSIKHHKLTSLGSLQGGFQLLMAHEGWLQIEGHSRAGGTESVKYLLRMNGSEYECIRSELRNGAKQTVTILINKTEQGAAANP